jgi:transposase-like protein|tara:strand:- start:2920 stop:3117 length:198 start_codon:yes stop_codon:yes gene_type:complete
MQDNWKRLAQALLDEEDYLNKQTRAFRKTRLATIKMMRNELSIQEIAKLLKLSRQRVYKIIEGGE